MSEPERWQLAGNSPEVYERYLVPGFERESFGAFNQLMAHLPPDEREAIWDEAEVAMQVFEGPQGFQAPCEPLLVVGAK